MMNDDLIKREDAIKVLESEDCFGYIECKTKALVKDINAIPSADRPTGQWVDKGWKGDWQFETDGRGNCWKVFECSICNGENTRKTCFCPCCGAKMKGADDEAVSR